MMRGYWWIVRTAIAAFLLASRLYSAEQAVEVVDTSKLPAPSSRAIDFARDVQPILQKTCHSCHGPEKHEGGLRLDGKSRAFAGGDSGRAFVPGKSADSRLIHLVAGLDSDAGRMPPDGEGTPLSSEQIAILRAWIDQGASWDDAASADTAATWWSLQPIRRAVTPTVRDPSWIRSPIDAFILAKLESQQIAPAPPTDRVTLARRVHLDLLGLPPTPDEMAEYLRDDRPNAYELLVDRLLASPHFGERWGRHWLDLARYADSDGYEKDRPRPFAWRYREWVLDAVNQDLPFDQFTVEQLAGDLLPEADVEKRVATGFHRNTLHNTEGGADPEEDRVKKTVDRTNTLGTAWLGLTVGCAQCHSHKYDSLTQREYFQLYAFFNNVDESDIDAALPVERWKYEKAKAAFDRSHAPYVAAIQKYEAEQLPAARAAWEATARQTSTAWTTLDAANVSSKHGAKLEKQADQSWLATGPNNVSEVYVFETASPNKSIRALRLEVLPDDRLPQKGSGRAENGNFVLSEFNVELLAENGNTTPLVWDRAQADFSQQDCDVANAINGRATDFWAVSPQVGQRHVAVFELKQLTEIPDRAKLRITLDQQYNRPTVPHNLGRFRLSVTDTSAPITLEGPPPEVLAALAVASDQRTPEQQQRVANYHQSIDPELHRLARAAADHDKKAPKAPVTKAQAVTQTPTLRETKIHIRGDFLNPGESVDVMTPAMLPKVTPRGKQLDRLDLARWIVAPENPLASRVAVNRAWEKLFGRGIVSTVDDFGKQGDRPSHPELLDWLAVEFRERGWSVKQIVREIVISSTYRQSSALRTELLAIDPENVWLARQNRRRVESEVIRDLSLAVSGLFDPRVGGPSVRPPQPTEHAKLTYANGATWAESQGGDRYRRGLYTFFQRTSPYPMLMTFDTPDSNECCAQRDSSNTPLQALTLWNDPTFFECAQAFGRRIVEVPAGPSLNETVRNRASFAALASLSRQPNEAELAELMNLFEQQRIANEKQPARIKELCGNLPMPSGVAPEELAAWIVVGRTLLNLDEFITRE